MLLNTFENENVTNIAATSDRSICCLLRETEEPSMDVNSDMQLTVQLCIAGWLCPRGDHAGDISLKRV